MACVTRYGKAARQLCRHAAGRINEPTVAVLLFGAGPAVIFATWMLQPVRRNLPDDLTPAMWLAGSWIILSPALIVIWERAFERLMCAVDRAERDERWNLEQIARRVRTVDRTQDLVSLTFAVTVAAGYTMNNGFFHDRTGADPIGSADYYSGLLVVTVIGYSFGVGIWGVAKTLIVAHAGIVSDIRWRPFRPGQAPALAAFGAFSYLTSALFSAGGVFLPGVYLISKDLNMSGQIIGGGIASCLVLGSFLSLLYPTYRMHLVSKTQKDEALTSFSEALERAHRDAVAGAGDMASLAARVEVLLALRSTILNERNSPPAQLLAARLGTLLILPTTVGLLQSIVSLGG